MLQLQKKQQAKAEKAKRGDDAAGEKVILAMRERSEKVSASNAEKEMRNSLSSEEMKAEGVGKRAGSSRKKALRFNNMKQHSVLQVKKMMKIMCKREDIQKLYVLCFYSR